MTPCDDTRVVPQWRHGCDGPQRLRRRTARLPHDRGRCRRRAAQETARLLADSMEPAVRLALIDALSAMAAEVTAALDGTLVDVRLRGRDPEVVVVPAAHEPPADPAARRRRAGRRRPVDRPDQPAAPRRPQGPRGGGGRRCGKLAEHLAGPRGRLRAAPAPSAPALQPGTTPLHRIRPQLTRHPARRRPVMSVRSHVAPCRPAPTDRDPQRGRLGHPHRGRGRRAAGGGRRAARRRGRGTARPRGDRRPGTPSPPTSPPGCGSSCPSAGCATPAFAVRVTAPPGRRPASRSRPPRPR